MSEEFIPLARFLSPPPAEPLALPLAQRPAAGEPLASFAQPAETVTEYAATFGAVRRFRAALADALDVAVQQLLAEIAENVLARELRLAGPDVAAIVAKTRERFSNERVLTVRVHPRDRNALGALEIDAVLDESLSPGDVIAELRSGTIDLRFRARLESALDGCAP
ncbi:MAG TPA: FliH/SctL family protein [Candidatus Acidoferrum sp.]|jgi:flagellar biosynthesis/type III secretory pathway protein FliH|nr:FliH/SctL family protein [Candidatus Acidoferrum sp.]